MDDETRDADKQRRRAEALRANLKRRKTAREGRETATDCVRDAARTGAAPPPGSIEGD